MQQKFSFPLLALAAVVLLCGAGQALAGGTPSDTDVTNQATLDYSVNSVPQTQASSNPVTFEVDKKVDLTIETDDTALVQVTPGATNEVLTFTVTNTGNDTQDIDLSASALVDGTADPFGDVATQDNFDDDITNVAIYVESGANSGYQAGEDTATYIDELLADGSVTVYIVRDIESTRQNDDMAVYALIGEIRAGGTANSLGGQLTQTASPTDGNVDTLFADAAGTNDNANDARHSDRSGFLVSTAAMTADKSQSVNGGYAIPGATVTYTIDIKNNGSATATDITITDEIPASTTFDSGTLSCPTGFSAEYSTDGTIGSWSTSETSPVGFVRCTGGSMSASSTASMSFDVSIN